MRLCRTTGPAAFATWTLALVACGGEEPPPAAPPPPAPPPSASAAEAPSAPPAPPPPPAPPKPTLAELMPQTLKGVGEAFNAHDAKKLSSYFTEDSAVVDYGGRTDHGRDDVASTGDRLFVTFPDAKLAATRVWFKGNVAVTEVVWTGTMSADTMHLKASHKPVGQLRVHVAWFNDDGLIKEEHQYADSAGLLAQMAGKKEAPPVPTLPTSLPEVHVAKGTPDEDKLAEWAKSIDDVWSKDDAKAAVALFADDGDFLTSMGGGPAVKGKKELTKGFTGWAKTFPDQKWTVANAWGVDGFAIVENSVSGTQKGPLGPLAATNKPVSSWHFVEIVQPTADGKIKHLWSYGNVLEAIQQLAPPKDAEHSDAKATSKDGVPKKTP